jgi:Arc/MetJ-type ribon-helix-helix transcriptional regulator
MMSTRDSWSILAEQGIMFRPSVAYAECWEYTISTLMEAWYGPYPTRDEALRAALNRLLTSAVLRAETVDPAAQLQTLREQQYALHIARARRGSSQSADLEPQIDSLIEKSKQIEERIKQSGDNPSISAVPTPDSTDREMYLHSLRQQLRALEKESALRGIAESSELEPRITSLIEEIRRIEEQDT